MHAPGAWGVGCRERWLWVAWGGLGQVSATPHLLGLCFHDLNRNLTKQCGGFVQIVHGGTDSRQRDLGFKPLSKHPTSSQCERVKRLATLGDHGDRVPSASMSKRVRRSHCGLGAMRAHKSFDTDRPDRPDCPDRPDRPDHKTLYALGLCCMSLMIPYPLASNRRITSRNLLSNSLLCSSFDSEIRSPQDSAYSTSPYVPFT